MRPCLNMNLSPPNLKLILPSNVLVLQGFPRSHSFWSEFDLGKPPSLRFEYSRLVQAPRRLPDWGAPTARLQKVERPRRGQRGIFKKHPTKGKWTGWWELLDILYRLSLGYKKLASGATRPASEKRGLRTGNTGCSREECKKKQPTSRSFLFSP